MSLFQVGMAVLGSKAVSGGIDYLANTSIGKSVASSGFGQTVGSVAGFLGITTDKISDLTGDIAGSLYGSKNLDGSQRLDFGDLPGAGVNQATAMAAARMQGAGQAQTIPLGSGNTVPNYLQNSRNARSTLQRIQTVPIPRATISGKAQTVALSSAQVKSRIRNKKQMLDKVTPLSAPPGHSLTGPQGRWAWDRPPQITNPDDAIDFIIEKLETGGGKDSLIKMMLAGITVEELVSQVAFKGFMAGMFTPDVAELIKPAIGIYLIGAAEDVGVDAVVFNSPPESLVEDVEDDTVFNIMRERNPQLYGDMVEELNRQQRMSSRPEPVNETPKEEPQQQSFLTAEVE